MEKGYFVIASGTLIGIGDVKCRIVDIENVKLLGTMITAKNVIDDSTIYGHEIFFKLQTARLKEQINGYTNIELIEKTCYKWRAIICGSGKEIEVFEDEFILD